MRDRIVHRGPDSAGEYVEPRAVLGVRRLRIIDLATGDQPMTNEDRTVWTVYNGEIYNFQGLRDELAAKGHRFVTRSDTETIVHLYEELGEGFVERIEGMFAVAVWDTRTGTLLLARDRMGKKPLLYLERDGELVFASEHAALLAGLRQRPAIDPAAVRAYLQLGYVPAPLDAFAGVRKLEPGHILVWRDGQVKDRRYWSPPQVDGLMLREEDAIAEFRRLFRAAVGRRLIADVPLGAFLSGGVDSSAVVATMADLTTRVRTFSIGFAEAEYSELEHARRIATRFATEHHEFVVGPLELDLLPELVRHFGEPYADSSAVPTYYLSRLTRQHVTVALNGDGGDEVFGGYDRYRASRLAARLDAVPRPLRLGLRGLATAVLPESASPFAWARRARRFARAVAFPPGERYLNWLGVFDTATLDAALAPEFAAATRSTDDAIRARSNAAFHHDPVTDAERFDLALYLPDDLLVKVDIASMANSLEVRSPFLDRDVVEFGLLLPAPLKIRGSEQKWLVKRAFAGVVPAENMYRRKQGFGVPVGQWFRGDLRGHVQEVVCSDRALRRGYLRPEAVRRLVSDHATGRADHTHRLWSLLMLELWHREFVDA